jgi:hypothetical protein
MSKYDELMELYKQTFNRQHEKRTACDRFFHDLAAGVAEKLGWPKESMKFMAMAGNEDYDKLRQSKMDIGIGPQGMMHFENGQWAVGLLLLTGTGVYFFLPLSAREDSEGYKLRIGSQKVFQMRTANDDDRVQFCQWLFEAMQKEARRVVTGEKREFGFRPQGT